MNWYDYVFIISAVTLLLWLAFDTHQSKRRFIEHMEKALMENAKKAAKKWAKTPC